MALRGQSRDAGPEIQKSVPPRAIASPLKDASTNRAGNTKLIFWVAIFAVGEQRLPPMAAEAIASTPPGCSCAPAKIWRGNATDTSESRAGGLWAGGCAERRYRP